MSIVLEQLSKRFGSQTVVDQVSLQVADGELFVLRGASGSGKSTILRLIAGLTPPDGGRVLLRGRDVGDLPPQRRGTGFVFQNYSIFQHMSVGENIEFGLKIRKVPAAERARRREELLELVDLGGMGSRLADQLSGGQQQRVALARALAYEPGVLLLDEPFGALDVKIRTQLRRSLKEIQKRLGVTTIFVTHDQEEAFELADRVGVIARGRLLEVGTAEALYARPRTLYVATFLGAGNVLVGRARGGQAHFGPLCLPIPAQVPHEDDSRVHLLFRPEDVALGGAPPPPGALVLGRGRIVAQSFSGPLRRVRLQLPALGVTRQLAPPLPFGLEAMQIEALLPASTPIADGELWATLRAWHILEQSPPRLLVCDSGKGPTVLLGLARHLVEKLDASATLLGVGDNAEAAAALRQEIVRRQEEEGLVPADVQVRHGHHAGEIAAKQAETPHDFLVLAASDRPGSHPERLGSTVLALLERSDTPLLIVKGERRELRRLLVCTAAGEPGKRDVSFGGRLARRLGAVVTVLLVTRGAGEPAPFETAHLERAAATLRALGVANQVRVRKAASPVEGILAEAREGDHDLVIVGGHGPRSRSFFGRDDITLQVLSGTDRSVLVIPVHESA